MWVGRNRVKSFRTPNGDERKFNNIRWYTNMDTGGKPKGLSLNRPYKDGDYNHLDNKDVIYVNKLKDIPKDYDGIMAVPTTIVNNLNHNQFEVIGLENTPSVGGKKKFSRYLIRRK